MNIGSSIPFVPLERKFAMSQTRTSFFQVILCYSSHGSVTANFTIVTFSAHPANLTLQTILPSPKLVKVIVSCQNSSDSF